MEIKKIKLSELEEFIKGEQFRMLEDKPISSFRQLSHIHNPHGQKDDIILYLGFIGKKLVAYRSLFGDYILESEKKTRFAWCSGNWVHPDHRRKGLSKLLLEEALKDWDGKLMFTNYAPASLNLYIESGKFKPIYKHHGVRCYLFPKLGELLRIKDKWKWLFVLPYVVLSAFSSLMLLFLNKAKEKGISTEVISKPDEECLNLMEHNKRDHLFSRGKEEFNWVFNFPWISKEDNHFVSNYHFSSFSKSFHYKIVKIFKDGKFEGFFMFSVRDGHLKTINFYISSQHQKFVINWLKFYCKKERIKMLTVYNPKIAQALFKSKFPFLYVKKYGQGIYSTFKIETKNKKVQDGDGDVVFT